MLTIEFAEKKGFILFRGDNLDELVSRLTQLKTNGSTYAFKPTEANCYLFRSFIAFYGGKGSESAKKLLEERPFHLPQITVNPSRKDKLSLKLPPVPEYKELARVAGCWPLSDGTFAHHVFKVFTIGKLYDEKLPVWLPRPTIPESLVEQRSAYETVEQLHSAPTASLFTGKAYLKSNVKFRRNTYPDNFQAVGISNLYDLLTTAPRRYIDRTKPFEVGNLILGETVTVIGTLEDVNLMPNGKGIIFTVREGLTAVRCVFWRQMWLQTKFRIGQNVVITGKVNLWRGSIQLGGETIEPLDSASLLPVTPVYPQAPSIGITENVMLSLVSEALETISDPKMKALYRKLHFPDNEDEAMEAYRELALKEITASILLKKTMKTVENDFVAFSNDGKLAEACCAALPFDLTSSQKKAINEFRGMNSSTTDGEGLLIADVGAGKTLVSQVLAVDAVESGFQSVFLAPTTVLAKQIFESTRSFVQPIGLTVAYLDPLAKAKERKKLADDVASGEIDVLVGTTGVLSDSLNFRNLGFLCVDEQQKFGVDQRDKLVNSRPDGLLVNSVNQSATPIPRTVASILYDGFTVVEMKGKPAGRLPIQTKWLEISPEAFCSQLLPEWSDIYREIEAGNRLLVVAPLVREDSRIDAASVESLHKMLSSGPLKNYSIGFVHGGLPKEKQNEEIGKLKSGATVALVGSAVIEVGVDIKDATRIIIFSPERMGASSLHQMRGRVGRNSKQSKCYLVTDKATSEASRMRLQALVDSNDGMTIASADLKTRDQGDIFGTSQSGASRLKFFSLNRDFDLVETAKKAAQTIVESGRLKEFLPDAMVYAGVSNDDLKR